MFHYELQIVDTGKVIFAGDTDWSMNRWQKWAEKKLLRYKRTSEEIKEVICNGGTIVGWSNYDKTVHGEKECRIVFRGMPRNE